MMRFVLEQVDGVSGVAAIAESTMLDAAQVTTMLDALETRGLVRFRGGRVVAQSAPAATGGSGVAARIDTVHAALARATHYEILGIPGDADKALVKRAYFVLSKEFHPDASAAKREPGARPKLEAIFRRLTEAHDALARPKRREAYDAELASAKREAFVERLHPPIEPKPLDAETNEPDVGNESPRSAASPETPRPTPRPPEAVRAETQPTAPASPAIGNPATPPLASSARPPLAAPRTDPSAPARPATPAPTSAGMRRPIVSTPSGPASTPPASPASSSRPAAAPSPSTSPRPPSSPQSARPPSVSVTRPPQSIEIAQRLARDIARQTGHSHAPPPPPSPPTSAADSQKSLLRALHGANQSTGSLDKTTQYERMAETAEAGGDLRNAVAYLRAALQFDATRADLRARLDAVDRRLAASESDELRSRAAADERAGRLELAASEWARVCLGRPGDADAHMNAARCLLEANLDLRQARDFAQKAVELDPKRIASRVLLARVFKSAGMRLNAQRELEAAAKLDPENQLVKNLQRELK